MSWDKFGEYGLVGLMAGAIILLLFFVIKWVLENTKAIIIQQAEERKCWNATIIAHNESLNKVVATIERHDEKAEQRATYVRQEHEKMIEALGRINGFK
jgi:hypothetical protein